MSQVFRNSLWLLLPTILAGCSQESSQVGTVAIVDLDAVAKGLGEDLELGKAIVAKRKELAAELTVLRRKLDQEYKTMKEKLGEDPNEEQTKKLRSLKQKHAAIIRNAQLEAEYKASAHNNKLIGRYRAKARPVAKRVASRMGFAIVMLKNDSLLSYDDAVDITNEVVAEMLKEADTP